MVSEDSSDTISCQNNLKVKDSKEYIEVLRVATMVGQQIDFVWALFTSTYLPAFGFVIFFSGEPAPEFLPLIILGTFAFVWLNGTSLWKKYNLYNTLTHDVLRTQEYYPVVSEALGKNSVKRRPFFLIFSHLFVLTTFLYLLVEKFGGIYCSGASPSGWSCIWSALSSAIISSA